MGRVLWVCHPSRSVGRGKEREGEGRRERERVLGPMGYMGVLTIVDHRRVMGIVTIAGSETTAFSTAWLFHRSVLNPTP